MRTLTQLQQNRRVIQDFTLTTLAGISGLFARLIYMASLRDLSSGRYEHAGLAALYPDAAIQQALQLCHDRFSNGFWKRHSPANRKICGPASRVWKLDCLARSYIGAASKSSGSFCRKQRPIISRNFSVPISGLFWRSSMRNVSRLIQARDHARHPRHNFRLFRHAPRLR